MNASIYVKQCWDKNTANENYFDQWISDEIWFFTMKAIYQDLDTFFFGVLPAQNWIGHSDFHMGQEWSYLGG